MTSSELIPATVLSLSRNVVVYVRQSTQSQVMTNLESQRRQYDLVGVARQRGFVDVEIIDDDLGRSASGTVARPGFSVRSYASTRRGLPATVVIGITCLNCADLSMPASLISMASTIPAGPMIACLHEGQNK
jgi:hypothetical protein